MKVTVGANGVTTPAVEVKPAPAPAVEVTPKPANPEAVKPLAPKTIEAPKVEVPAPDAKPVEPKLEVPAPEAAAPAKP
jgi:hypothetical protein